MQDSGWWQPPRLPRRLYEAVTELWKPQERDSWWSWWRRILGDPDGYGWHFQGRAKV
jgi:hypothetical protein